MESIAKLQEKYLEASIREKGGEKMHRSFILPWHRKTRKHSEDFDELDL